MLPMNIIGEIATPISMAFRHFGNVLSGTVISTLIAALLQTISSAILGRIPVIGNIPIFQIGLPAVFSVYFDLFSGCLQAFIFAMLTMLNISGGFPEEAYLKRMEKKNKKKQATSAKA
jgi:F-type H+-transporting ATPase subunit a